MVPSSETATGAPDGRNSERVLGCGLDVGQGGRDLVLLPSRRPDDQVGGGALRRVGVAEVAHRLHLGDRGRQRLEVGAVRLHAERRDGEQHDDDAGHGQRDERVPEDRAEDPAADGAAAHRDA